MGHECCTPRGTFLVFKDMKAHILEKQLFNFQLNTM